MSFKSPRVLNIRAYQDIPLKKEKKEEEKEEKVKVKREKKSKH
jgi:hypothetical protein